MKNRRLFFRPILLLGLVILCCSIVPSSGAQDSVADSAAQDLFQSAEDAWRARRWEEAAAKYQALFQDFPAHPLAARARVKFADYLGYVTKTEEAMAAYEPVISMAPHTREAQEAQIGLAALHNARGEYGQARDLFREVLSKAKDWDVVKYATYRLKEINRKLQASESQTEQTAQCGVQSLAEVFKLKGKEVSLTETSQVVALDEGMASLAALKKGAEAKEVPALGVKLNLDQLKSVATPVIAHFRPNHYVVVTNLDEDKISVIDPDWGNIVFPKQSFQEQWTGYALIFPQQEQPLDPAVVLSDEEMQRVKGGHHLHGNNHGGQGSNGPSVFHPGPSPPSGGQCKGVPNISVNLSNFNLLVQDTDFAYVGRGPGVFVQRTYNADDSEEGAFGRSWTFNYELELVEEPNGNVKIKREDGKVDYFTKIGCAADGTCTYNPPLWSHDKLGKNPDGTFDLQVKRARLTQHFDTQGRLTRITDRNGNAVTLQYDANSRLQSVRDTVGRITTFFYGANGKISKVRDPAGREATYLYDGNNNLTKTTDMAGNVINYTYDTNSYMASLTTPKGTYRINNVFYDSTFGLVVSSITDPLGNTNSYSTPGGVIVEVRDAAGNPSRYFPSGNGEVTQITNPLGNTIKFTFNSFGERTSITDSKGNRTNLAYDNRGNLTSITDPLGNKVTLTFDSRDNLTSLKEPPTPANPQGNTYTYAYDPKDNLTKATDPTTGSTAFLYDSFGQLTSLTDARSNTTRFTYDSRGNLASMRTPLGHTTFYSYDPIGRLIGVTTPKGATITYSYDGIDRVKSIAYPDGNTILYTYECCNLTRVSDNNGTVFLDYDTGNRLTDFTDIHGKTLQYAYDKAGNLISLIYPDGKVVSYAYDKANRLTKVTDWLGNTIAYTYDAAGNLIYSVTSTGLTTAYQYDKGDRLTALTNAKPDASLISYYKYTLDALGNRTHIDAQEPLSPVLPNRNIAYNPADADNRLTAANNGTTFSYDNNGNLTRETRGTYLKSYSYNFDDRLLQASVSSQTVQYKYDGLANRTEKTVGSTVTRYVLDSNGVLSQVVAETDGSGNIKTYYVYGLGLASKVTSGGQVYFYQYDGLGSTVAMTDAFGSVVNKYAYDPFGNLSSNSTETIPNPFRYVGRFGVMDEGNGLLYMRARYYAPGVGRFISEDPIGLMGGQNIYTYINTWWPLLIEEKSPMCHT